MIVDFEPVGVALPSVQRTNRHPNPFAVGLTGWTATGRAATLGSYVVGSMHGARAVMTGASGTSAMWTCSAAGIPVVGGEPLPISLRTYLSTAGQVQVQCEWKDGVGAVTYSPTDWRAVASGVLTEITTSLAVPAGTVSARVVVSANGAMLSVGDWFFVGGVMVDASGAPFSGDTFSDDDHTYEWAGTPYASASEEWSVAVVADTDAPAWRLLISDIPAGTAKLGIVRVADSREWTVRIAGPILAGTTAATEDHEVPTGVPVWYRVSALDVDGAVLAEVLGLVSLIWPDAPHSQAWLSDPLDNTSARLVNLFDDGNDAERPMPMSHTQPFGGDLVHTAFGVRGAAVRSYRVKCESVAEYLAVSQLLSGPILIRPPMHYMWGAAIYGVAEGQTERVQPHLAQGFRAYLPFTITPSRGPGIGVLKPRRTWQDVLNEAATWQELMDQYGTWGDVLRGQY